MSPSVLERVQQTHRLWRAEGPARVAHRLRGRAASALAPAGLAPLPVRPEVLQRAAEVARAGWELPPPLPAAPGAPLHVAFICLPPSPGAGGHTTMFRLIAALERAGHACTVYLDDQHGWALDQHRRTIRAWWPWVGAEVRDLAAGIADAHAIVATGWASAYAALASPARGARCYLVQDFEPWFFPAGSEALLAEATYRFGFRGITAGPWLAERLRRDYGMRADPFAFGCDLEAYGLDPALDGARERTGVCCYCRPATPRRALGLALAALELFARAHPEVPIHLYGGQAPPLGFPAIEHGVLAPEQLSALYNRCIAGLSLSATNVSLVPNELLAAGCVPVVNDAEQNRAVLENPHVVYAPATPFELAAALGELVEAPVAGRLARAAEAAASVSGASWEAAGVEVERLLRAEVERHQRVPVAA